MLTKRLNRTQFWSIVALLAMVFSFLKPASIVSAWHGYVGDPEVQCDGSYKIPVNTTWVDGNGVPHVGYIISSSGLTGKLPDGVNQKVVTYSVKIGWSDSRDTWSETSTRTVTRPDCNKYEVKITGEGTCSGWTTKTTVSTDGATLSYTPAASGSWDNNTSVTVTVKATWPNGKSAEDSVMIQKPDCREYSVKLTGTPTCDGWSVKAETSVEGAQLSFNPGQTGTWGTTNSVTVTVTATWSNGKTADSSITLQKPDCRKYEVSITVTPTCTGWTAAASTTVEGATLSFNPGSSGSWDNSDSVTVSVKATWPNGKTAEASATATKPDCRTYSVSLTITPTCSGWTTQATTTVEGAELSYSPASAGDWSAGDSVSVTVTATWPNGKTAQATASANKPDCRDYTIEVTGSATCTDWSASAKTSVEGAEITFSPASSGSWADGESSVDVTATATWANGKSASAKISIARPDCNDYSLKLSSESTCKVWSVKASTGAPGATVTFEPGEKGTWEKDQMEVKVHASASWPNGKTAEAEITVYLPENCGGPKKPPKWEWPAKPYECSSLNCGPRQEERPGDNEVSFAWTTLAKCEWTWDYTCNGWSNAMDKARMVDIMGGKNAPFSIYWAGEFIPAKLQNGVYKIYNAPVDGTWSLWSGLIEGKWDNAKWERGEYKRLRDVLGTKNVREYISCAISYWEGDEENGQIIWKAGSNTWELAYYLVKFHGYSQAEADKMALTAHDTGKVALTK